MRKNEVKFSEVKWCGVKYNIQECETNLRLGSSLTRISLESKIQIFPDTEGFNYVSFIIPSGPGPSSPWSRGGVGSHSTALSHLDIMTQHMWHYTMAQSLLLSRTYPGSSLWSCYQKVNTKHHPSKHRKFPHSGPAFHCNEGSLDWGWMMGGLEEIVNLTGSMSEQT